MPWSYDFIHSTIYKQLKAQVTAYTELKLAKKKKPILHCLHNKTANSSAGEIHYHSKFEINTYSARMH